MNSARSEKKKRLTVFVESASSELILSVPLLNTNPSFSSTENVELNLNELIKIFEPH